MVIKCTQIQHKNKPCILFHFPYNALLNNALNRLEFAKYSNTYKCWYISQNNTILQQVIFSVATIAKVDVAALKLTPNEAAA